MRVDRCNQEAFREVDKPMDDVYQIVYPHECGTKEAPELKRIPQHLDR